MRKDQEIEPSEEAGDPLPDVIAEPLCSRDVLLGQAKPLLDVPHDGRLEQIGGRFQQLAEPLRVQAGAERQERLTRAGQIREGILGPTSDPLEGRSCRVDDRGYASVDRHRAATLRRPRHHRRTRGRRPVEARTRNPARPATPAPSDRDPPWRRATGPHPRRFGRSDHRPRRRHRGPAMTEFVREWDGNRRRCKSRRGCGATRQSRPVSERQHPSSDSYGRAARGAAARTSLGRRDSASGRTPG